MSIQESRDIDYDDIDNEQLARRYELLTDELGEVVEEIRYRSMNEHLADDGLPELMEEGLFDEQWARYYLEIDLL